MKASRNTQLLQPLTTAAFVNADCSMEAVGDGLIWARLPDKGPGVAAYLRSQGFRA